MVEQNYFPLIVKPTNIEDLIHFFIYRQNDVKDYLSKIYGDEQDIIDNRRQEILTSLNEFRNIFPENQYVVVNRMPCRVNTQGNHIDHRGGTTNPVLHRREILSVASIREDQQVLGYDILNEYPPFNFNIAHEIAGNENDWFEFIESDKLKNWINENRHKNCWWQSYVRAGVLGACFLMLARNIEDVKGMNIFINGDIPPGGLSSSSGVVMVSLLSFCQLNEIKIDREQFVDIAGDAEWYVGSRGGKGDHAAITFTKQGTISHPSFIPLKITRFIPYPKKADFVIVNSVRKSEKTTEEKSTFNTRVATYEAAQLFFWKIIDDFSQFPLLRDVLKLDRYNVLDNENKVRNTINLYNLIKKLPVICSYEKVMELYEECLTDFCQGLQRKVDSKILNEYLQSISKKINSMIVMKSKNNQEDSEDTKSFLNSIHSMENQLLISLESLPKKKVELERLLSTEKLINRFDFAENIQIRQVALFGLAEMARAYLHGDYLIEENYEAVGKLMNASHDGDRKYILNQEGKYIEFTQDFSEQFFDKLIDNLQNGKEKLIEESLLENVPGGYSCSCIELDRGVDIALRTKGTYGAKMVGGGLGGNFIVLSSEPKLLLKTLTEEYFIPKRNELNGEISYDERKIFLKSCNQIDILAEIVVPVEAGGPIVFSK